MLTRDARGSVPDYVAESGHGLNLVAALCKNLERILVDGEVIWALLDTE